MDSSSSSSLSWSSSDSSEADELFMSAVHAAVQFVIHAAETSTSRPRQRRLHGMEDREAAETSTSHPPESRLQIMQDREAAETSTSRPREGRLQIMQDRERPLEMPVHVKLKGTGAPVPSPINYAVQNDSPYSSMDGATDNALSQTPVHAKLKGTGVPASSPVNFAVQNDSPHAFMDGATDNTLSQAEYLMHVHAKLKGTGVPVPSSINYAVPNDSPYASMDRATKNAFSQMPVHAKRSRAGVSAPSPINYVVQNNSPYASMDVATDNVPVHAKLLGVQVPSPINYDVQNDSQYASTDGAAYNALFQKLEDELLFLGKNIKHHEDNIKHLKAHKNSLDDQITDMQVIIGKHHSSSTAMTEDGDLSNTPSEQSTIETHGTQADPASTDVFGVVATLGKVEDDNLSRLLSKYLGVDIMLALVCITCKDLRTHEKEWLVSKSSKVPGNVICVESLRPYVGEVMGDDPQRRLALLKPKLPNGKSPAGFLGFAVNMIHIDPAQLLLRTSDGHGLRETLFYALFSRLQVYRSRAHMLQAIPCISDGAISLDGGIIRSNGIFACGTWGREREEMDVKFCVRCGKWGEIEKKKMKELEEKKGTTMEELQREEAMLTHVKYNFQVKKQEFVRVVAQTSSSSRFQQLHS